MAVTTPVALTVATDGVALLHTPDAVALESVVVAPIQTLVVPVMLATAGRAFTVMVYVDVALQPLIVTV